MRKNGDIPNFDDKNGKLENPKDYVLYQRSGQAAYNPCPQCKSEEGLEMASYRRKDNSDNLTYYGMICLENDCVNILKRELYDEIADLDVDFDNSFPALKKSEIGEDDEKFLDDLMVIAFESLNNGNPILANASFQTILHANPHNKKAALGAADSAMQIGMPLEAIHYYSVYLSHDNYQDNELVKKIYGILKNFKFYKPAVYYSEILIWNLETFKSVNLEDYLEHINCYIAAEDYENAINFIESRRKRLHWNGSKNINILLLHASCYVYLKEYDKAMELIREMVILQPDNWTLHKAIRDDLLWNRFLDYKSPLDVDAASDLSFGTLFMTEEKAQSLKPGDQLIDYYSSIMKNPYNFTTWMGLRVNDYNPNMLGLTITGEDKVTSEACDHYLNLNQEYSEIIHKLEGLKSSGQKENIIEILNLFFKIEEFESFIELAESNLSKIISNSKLISALLICYSRTDRPTKGIDLLFEEPSLLKDNYIKQMQITLLLQNEQYEEAQSKVKDLIKSDPDNLENHVLHIRTYVDSKMYNDALEIFYSYINNIGMSDQLLTIMIREILHPRFYDQMSQINDELFSSLLPESAGEYFANKLKGIYDLSNLIILNPFDARPWMFLGLLVQFEYPQAHIAITDISLGYANQFQEYMQSRNKMVFGLRLSRNERLVLEKRLYATAKSAKKEFVDRKKKEKKEKTSKSKTKIEIENNHNKSNKNGNNLTTQKKIYSRDEANNILILSVLIPGYTLYLLKEKSVGIIITLFLYVLYVQNYDFPFFVMVIHAIVWLYSKNELYYVTRKGKTKSKKKKFKRKSNM